MSRTWTHEYGFAWWAHCSRMFAHRFSSRIGAVDLLNDWARLARAKTPEGTGRRGTAVVGAQLRAVLVAGDQHGGAARSGSRDPEPCLRVREEVAARNAMSVRGSVGPLLRVWTRVRVCAMCVWRPCRFFINRICEITPCSCLARARPCSRVAPRRVAHEARPAPQRSAVHARALKLFPHSHRIALAPRRACR